MAAYNEADILEQVLKYHIDQGLQLIIADNGSTDGSREIAERYIGRGVLAVQKIPTDYIDLHLLMSSLSEVAAKHEPNWLVLIGADEFLETSDKANGETLVEGLRTEDSKGYGVIQFDTYEFWPTRLDDSSEKDVRCRMRYYTWLSAYNFRAYRWTRGSRFYENAHYPTPAPGTVLRISPRKFILRHYRYRSFEHGVRKAFQERIPRFRNQSERWVHYDNAIPKKPYFVRDPRELNFYSEDGRWLRSRKFDPMFGSYDWEKNQPDDYTPPGMTR
ncbi:MAG: glycosyltransferase family 2 protein [Candidatus Bathyarchaeia archaeon]